MMKYFKILLLALTALLFTACTAPVADAGADQSVNVGDTVTLDGSGSTDDDGNELTFVWTMTSKPDESTAALSNMLIVKPEFVADKEGNYTVTLVVNDGNSDSDPDSVLIVASQENAAPVADAGRDQTVQLGETVQLDGSGSSDANDDTLTYKWNMTEKPAQSAAVLSGEESVDPAFEADAEGIYTVELVVNDGSKESAADAVNITVRENNTIPVADAGPDQQIDMNASDVNGTDVNATSVITLDGSGSYDADGDDLNYNWSFIYRPTGSSAVLSDTTIVNPKFTADINSTYVIQLIVNDGNNSSKPDTVAVVTKESRP